MSSLSALIPRQHGTYAQLLVPLMCAWMVVSEAPPAGWLSASAVLFFLAGAPLLELRRSPRFARRALLVYVTGALLALALGLFHATPLVAGLTFAPLTLLCVTLAFVLWGAARSLAGEVSVALALSSCCGSHGGWR